MICYLAAISCFLSRPADALLTRPEMDRAGISPGGIRPRTSGGPGDHTLPKLNSGFTWLVRETIRWLIRKKREYKGEEVEQQGKRGNFHCTWGKKNIISEKEGVAKLSYSAQYINPLVKLYKGIHHICQAGGFMYGETCWRCSQIYHW